MKIGIAFYGITSGLRPSHAGGPVGSDRDIRHCWPDHKKMLINPLLEKGHSVNVYLSTYPFLDINVQKYVDEIICPIKIRFSNVEGSDPFTTKGACLKSLLDQDLDFVIICRIDMHFSKVLANENIDYEKFNFLFKEEGYWHNHRFTTDNFYMFPFEMIENVDKALQETYLYPRGWPMVDTHGLYDKLTQYILEEKIHFVSEEHELSDVNSYYTVCRSGLPTNEVRTKLIHSSVKEKFGYR